MSTTRARGPLAVFVALAVLLTAAAAATSLLLQPFWFDRARIALGTGAFYGVISALALTAALATLLSWLTKRTARETLGRARLLLLGVVAAVAEVAWIALSGVLWLVQTRLPAGAPLTFEELLLLAPEPFKTALIVCTSLAVAGSAVALGSAVAAWFLLSEKLRKRVFIAVDALLFALTTALTLFVQLPGPDEVSADLLAPSLRLAITFLLLIRLFLRLLPWTLDAIERIDFRTIVAARHLRAKKSGFLAAISFLSILAVSVSSCALTTTLSVMGGFRQDLQRKILGNNAHIVIDRAEGKIADANAMVERARKTEGVRGVSPYLSGEVMVSSASNLSGAILRGIDLDHIGDVSELPRNVRTGSLEYLRDPSKMNRGTGKSAPSYPPKLRI